uniref:Coat protein n=1 Tax=Botrytis cinerea partitivirus 1 TaxID=1354497 RepID=S5DU46_9VIRU|nr:coat protein [Botrytis cinerea partitivirus 1]
MSSRITSPSQVSGIEIRTPSALAALAKKFSPVILQHDDTPVPPSNSDYFARMQMPTNIELDSGNYATIHAQFDTRYVHNYILNHITALYPDMNIKGHPYVTPASLAGYCLTIFYAHMLVCDATFAPEKSYPAARFLSDADRKDLYETLLRAYVPTFLSDLLLELAPVYDPRRNNHLTVPSLAAYLHLHDFGRTLPPSMYYNVHHLLASTRTNKDPDDVIDDIMALPCLTYGSRDFTISNYLGTWYSSGHHSNFVNQDFISFVNPIVGRTLSTRPTFARMPLMPEILADDNTGNIYTALLFASDQNISLMNTVISAISTFIHTDQPSAPQLGSTAASLSGTLLLSHSIEPITVPTWTGAVYKTDPNPSNISDEKFVKDHNFMDGLPSTSNKNLSYPSKDDDLNKSLYHEINQKFDPTTAPYQYLKYNGKQHIIPSVLYFQPYDVSPSSLALTIVSGLKIELAEIDGFMVPTEHPESSLDDNNSQYLQSAIRANKIAPVFSAVSAPNAQLRILPRRDLDRTSQSITASIISMAKTVYPFFATSGLPFKIDTTLADSGLTPEKNHFQSKSAFNVKSGLNGQLSTTDNAVYLWSSYRVVHQRKNPGPADISMLASFRPIYGTNITLSRSKHPSLIIPH